MKKPAKRKIKLYIFFFLRLFIMMGVSSSGILLMAYTNIKLGGTILSVLGLFGMSLLLCGLDPQDYG